VDSQLLFIHGQLASMNKIIFLSLLNFLCIYEISYGQKKEIKNLSIDKDSVLENILKANRSYAFMLDKARLVALKKGAYDSLEAKYRKNRMSYNNLAFNLELIVDKDSALNAINEYISLSQITKRDSIKLIADPLFAYKAIADKSKDREDNLKGNWYYYDSDNREVIKERDIYKTYYIDFEVSQKGSYEVFIYPSGLGNINTYGLKGCIEVSWLNPKLCLSNLRLYAKNRELNSGKIRIAIGAGLVDILILEKKNLIKVRYDKEYSVPQSEIGDVVSIYRF
jgi:hypothetical protein